MHAKLRITLTAAALVTAVPAAGIASAHEVQRGGSGESKAAGRHDGGGDHGGKVGKRCDRPRGFEAQGLLAAGSSLEQVAGADTARRGDDRFSGTVIVAVRKGARRQRHGEGGGAQSGTLTSFAVDSVRALGTATGTGDAPLPAVGTRVLLVGTIAKAACPTATPSPTVTPDADYPAGTTAARASLLADDDPAEWDEDASDAADRSSGGAGAGVSKGGDGSDDDDPGDDASSSDDPTSTTPGATTPASPTTAAASTAVIKLVVFKSGERSRR